VSSATYSDSAVPHSSLYWDYSGHPLQGIKGKACIVSSQHAATLSGKSLVTIARTTAVTGKASIEHPPQLTGKANIYQQPLYILTGKGYIGHSQHLKGKADILNFVDGLFLIGKAAVQQTVNTDIAGKASITPGRHSADLSGKAWVANSVSQRLKGKSNLTRTTDALLTGKANVYIPSTRVDQTLSGKASISTPILKTLTGKAYLRTSYWVPLNSQIRGAALLMKHRRSTGTL
jgi:hypothetical protein